MLHLEFVYNIAILVSLVVVYDQIMRHWKRESGGYQILSGLLFRAVALIAMAPVHILPGVKVIVSSGFLADDAGVGTVEGFAKAHLKKPHKINELLTTVRLALDVN